MEEFTVVTHAGRVSISTPGGPVVVKKAAVINLPNGKCVISFGEVLKHPFDGYAVLGSDKAATAFVDTSSHGSLFLDVRVFFTTSPLINTGEVYVSAVMANQSARLANLGTRVAAWREAPR